MGLLYAEQTVGNLKKSTFKTRGTPVRRTNRRKSQKMHFQEFWDSCAQNKTSEISKAWTFWKRNLGLLCAEQHVGNLKQMCFQEFWDSCAQNKTSEISNNALELILGLLCAEQNVENLNKCTFRNCGTPIRRRTRRESQKVHFQNFWDSDSHDQTSEISKIVTFVLLLGRVYEGD